MKKGFFDAGQAAKASVPAAPPGRTAHVLRIGRAPAQTRRVGASPEAALNARAKRARRKRNAARRSNGTSGHAVPEAAAAWKAAPPDVDGLVSIARPTGRRRRAEKLAGLSFEFTASSPSAPAALRRSRRASGAAHQEAHAVHVDPRSGAPLEVRVFGRRRSGGGGARGELEALFASLQERRVALPALLAADLAERIQADLRAGSLPGWPAPPPPRRPAWRDESDEQESDEEEEGRGPGPAGRERVEVVVEGGELLLRGRGLPLSDLQRLSDAVAAHADALARPHEARSPIFAKEAAYVEQEGLAEEVAARHAGVQIRVERERSQPKPPAPLRPRRAPLHRPLPRRDTDRDDVEAAWRSIARLLVSARAATARPAASSAPSRGRRGGAGGDRCSGASTRRRTRRQLLEARVELSEEQDEALRDLAAQGKSAPLPPSPARRSGRAAARGSSRTSPSPASRTAPTSAVVFRVRPPRPPAPPAPPRPAARLSPGPTRRGAEQRAGRGGERAGGVLRGAPPRGEAEAARRAKLVYETLRLSAELYDSELAAFIECPRAAGGCGCAVSVQQRTAAAVLLRLEGASGTWRCSKAAVERESAPAASSSSAAATASGDDPFGGFGAASGRLGAPPPAAKPVCPLAHIDESKIARRTGRRSRDQARRQGPRGPHEARTRTPPAPPPPLTAAAQTLGLERSASESEVKKAYYMQARKFHPDKCAH
eukprot:tig00021795_g23545.t1